MPIKRMCCHAGCPRYREEGSKFCSVHREADEAKDRKRYADYLSNRYNRQHTTSVYADLYRSSEWKELRKKVIEQHPYCAECGSKFGLQVHHNYAPGVDYSSPDMFFNPDALEVLCTSCHSKETDRRKK